MLMVSALVACGGASSVPAPSPGTLQSSAQDVLREPTADAGLQHTQGADVAGVTFNGNPGSYSFSVTIQSPDTGCGQYADWWEIISPGGELIYRRVLLHSHVDEQPFTRSGGPVDVQPGETVIIRAHINNGGYGRVGLRGSVESGFTRAQFPADLHSGLASTGPLPSSCAF